MAVPYAPFDEDHGSPDAFLLRNGKKGALARGDRVVEEGILRMDLGSPGYDLLRHDLIQL